MGESKPATKKTASPKKKPAVKKAAASGKSQKTAVKKPAAKKASPPKKAAAAPGRAMRPFTAEERWRMIAEAAYLIAEKRGFVGGDPAEDWYAAEAQINTLFPAG